jgi:aquaporin related protein
MVSGALPWVRGCLLIPAQIAGAIIAAGLNTCMLPGPIAVITTLTNGTSVRQGLFIEAFLTSLLVFVILMLAAEKHATTHIAPVGIGLALFAAELAGPSPSFSPSIPPSTPRSLAPSLFLFPSPHYH